MSVFFIIAVFAAISLPLIAVSYWGERLFGDRPIGTLLLCLLATAVALGLEHYIAIPSALLLASGLLASAYGGWLLHTGRMQRPGAAGLVVLGLFFIYPLIWRWGFPSIYPTSERVTDLYFISHFIDSQKLPAIDRWLPPYRFDFYYPLQFYWGGLFVRSLNIPIGFAYNFGVVFLMGGTGYLIWHVARRETRHWRSALVITAALVIGGSGAAPYIATQIASREDIPSAQASLRAITADARFNGDGGRGLQAPDTAAGVPKPLELPLEPYSYQYYLGDFHPTLTGLLIAFLMVALMLRYETPTIDTARRKRSSFALGAITTISIVGNTWIFPLAAMATGLWTLWKLATDDRHAQRLLPLVWTAGGGIGALVVLLPVLKGLAARQLQTPMLWVPAELHSPLLPWLVQWWPLLGLTGLALVVLPRRSLGFFLALLTIALLAFSELFYINDLSINEFERTNSTLKWWGWIWSFSVFGLGVTLLAQRRPTVSWLTTLLLIPGLVSGYWYARYWLGEAKTDAGKLDGSHFYTRDPQHRELIDYLRQAPDGVTVESIAGNAYTDTGMLSLLGGKRLYMGWPDHEYTWRGGLVEIQTRVNDVNKLYARELTDAPQWLIRSHIDFVIWSIRDCNALGDQAAWQLNDQIKRDYDLKITGWWGNCPVGVWTRQGLGGHAEPPAKTP